MKQNSKWKAKSKMVLDYELKHTTRDWMSDLPDEGEHQRTLKGGRTAGLGRPAWVVCCSSQLRFSPVHSCLLCSSVTACFLGLHRPNVLVHSFACMIDPSTWWFCFESLPCSLASHASMRFLQSKALDGPPCLSFACGLMKNVGGASRDA
jgi:hypothetical protein